MKIIKISMRGIEPVNAVVHTPKKESKKPYWVISHGKKGRGSWEVNYRLALSEFGHPDLTIGNSSIIPMDEEYEFTRNLGTDAKKNGIFVIGRSNEEDGTFMVLLELDPGDHGTVIYSIEGKARLIGTGVCNNKSKGKALAPILLAGPEGCVLRWRRTGENLEGYISWKATLLNGQWFVEPDETLLVSSNHAKDHPG